MSYFGRIPAENSGAQGLCMQLRVKAGEYRYIPAGVPHLPYNPSESEGVTAVIARTDPKEQERVVLPAPGAVQPHPPAPG
jgi:uncharacterized RmlC-like cupin family protein